MKLFVCALLIIALIVGGCAWGSAYVTGQLDEMLSLLQADIPTDEHIPENAAAVSKALTAAWEKNHFLISMFLPHHHLDDIRENLAALSVLSEHGEFPDWTAAKRQTEEVLVHLRGLMQVSADNIL